MAVDTEFHVLIVETPSLGDRSYVVHDGSVGVVIDPQRDIDRVLAEVDAASLRLTHVLETHVHNDYVSGGLALARRTGAEYVTCADDDARFERRGVFDGEHGHIGLPFDELIHEALLSRASALHDVPRHDTTRTCPRPARSRWRRWRSDRVAAGVRRIGGSGLVDLVGAVPQGDRADIEKMPRCHHPRLPRLAPVSQRGEPGRLGS